MLNRVLTLNRHLRSFSTFEIPQLTRLGIKNNNIKYNLSYSDLFENEIKNKEGHIFKTQYGKHLE